MRDPKHQMWAEACALLKQAEQLHRQFFEPAREGARAARWEPPVDMFETERELWIIAALPGVAPEAACASPARALPIGHELSTVTERASRRRISVRQQLCPAAGAFLCAPDAVAGGGTLADQAQ